MGRFIIRRVIFSAVAMIAATTLVFFMTRSVGDPRLVYAAVGGYGMSQEQWDGLGRAMGLDKPLIVQYLIWMGNLLKGDWGTTLLGRTPVLEVIAERVGHTTQLALGGMIFTLGAGVPLGVLSAVKRGSIWDYLARGFALLGQSLPSFWVGIMAILLFAVTLGWLPSGTRGDEIGFPGNLKHYILPAIILGWLPSAELLRITRSAMLEVMDSEYIKLARAKGVSHRSVIWKHALRNAAIPPLTLLGILMASFVTGSVVLETVFAWPGMGRLAVESVAKLDFPIVIGTVLIWTGAFLVLNLVVDVIYAVIDPRIRYT